MRPSVARVLLLGQAALLLAAASCRKAGPVSTPIPPGAPRTAPAPTPHREVVPEEGGEVVFALEDPFSSLTASRLATSSDRIIRSLAFRGLARLTPSGAAEPELAVKWEVLRSGAEWVLHLRPETRFSGGRYLEARHVAASWERLIADRESRYAWLLEAVRGFSEVRSGEATHASGIIVEEGLVLRLILDRPVAGFPLRLAHPALGISAFGEDQEGTGPFRIWGVPRSDRITLRSNPEYFRELPHLDEITFVRGEAANRSLLITGALEGALLPPGEAGPSEAGVRLFSHSVPRTYVLGLNRAVAPFSRADLARELFAALDRPALLREVGEGGHVPRRIVSSLSPGATAEETPPRPFPRGQGLGRLDLIFPDSDRTASLLAQRVQSVLVGAGGRVLSHPVRSSDIGGVLARREYHLFVLPYLPASPSLLLDYEEVIEWNRSVPGTLVGQARALENQADTASLSASLISLDDALQAGGYLFPLAAVDRRMLVGDVVCNLRPDPVGSLDWTAIWRSRKGGGRCGAP